MGVITGSLMGDIMTFKSPKPEDKLEMALLINDEKGVWRGFKGETKEDEKTRIHSQKTVLSGCMKLGCRIIIVEQLPFYETCCYICVFWST